MNNAFCEADFVDLGTLPSGAGFYVNRLAAECDLLVTEGFIEPHFFAGFSGGRKSILPGICVEKTVNENHSFKAISSPWAKTGVLKHNPIHEDMIAVATAEACCAESGVIIMCCSCIDGMGGTNFEKLITLGTPEEIEAYLSQIPPDKTIPEQWCPQIYARILKKHKVILVTTYLDHELVRKANMIPASTPDEALAIAYEMKGPDAKVVVIPDGVAVLAVS